MSLLLAYAINKTRNSGLIGGWISKINRVSVVRHEDALVVQTLAYGAVNACPTRQAERIM